MTDKEKDKYKRIANKLNENRQPQDNSKQIINLHSNSNDYWSMKNYLTDLFEFIPNNAGKRYIYIYFNVYLNLICLPVTMFFEFKLWKKLYYYYLL